MLKDFCTRSTVVAFTLAGALWAFMMMPAYLRAQRAVDALVESTVLPTLAAVAKQVR